MPARARDSRIFSLSMRAQKRGGNDMRLRGHAEAPTWPSCSLRSRFFDGVRCTQSVSRAEGCVHNSHSTTQKLQRTSASCVLRPSSFLSRCAAGG
eukprot:2482855-Pleurochrysis_carterae.AAC.1